MLRHIGLTGLSNFSGIQTFWGDGCSDGRGGCLITEGFAVQIYSRSLCPWARQFTQLSSYEFEWMFGDGPMDPLEATLPSVCHLLHPQCK